VNCGKTAGGHSDLLSFGGAGLRLKASCNNELGIPSPKPAHSCGTAADSHCTFPVASDG